MTSHIVLSEHPLNSEPHPSALVQGFDTPDALVFNRNHGEVQHISPQDYLLSLSSPDGALQLDKRELKLDAVMMSFKKRSVPAILTCAGLRRSEMNESKEVEGLKWDRGALANATWSGSLLRDVLVNWGVPEEGDFEGLHCHFEADQVCEDDSYYGGSVPLSVAMDKTVPALLAYEMNGAELTPAHGAPLRVVIPGVIGARSVKWVRRVLIKKEESQCFYQTKDYKILPPTADADSKAKYMKETEAMLRFSMNTSICCPEPGQHIKLSAGSSSFEVSGYAYGTNGTPLAHVFVSTLPCTSKSTTASLHSDAGRKAPSSWVEAELTSAEPIEGKNYAWTLWKAQMEVPGKLKEEKEVALIAFCEDINGQKQPLETDWNLRGLGETSWSITRINVSVE